MRYKNPSLESGIWRCIDSKRAVQRSAFPSDSNSGQLICLKRSFLASSSGCPSFRTHARFVETCCEHLLRKAADSRSFDFVLLRYSHTTRRSRLARRRFRSLQIGTNSLVSRRAGCMNLARKGLSLRPSVAIALVRYRCRTKGFVLLLCLSSQPPPKRGNQYQRLRWVWTFWLDLCDVCLSSERFERSPQ